MEDSIAPLSNQNMMKVMAVVPVDVADTLVIGSPTKAETQPVVSTTTAGSSPLIPDHGLVLVETTQGNLLLSVANDMGNVNYTGDATTADLQGRQLLTSSLPGLLSQVQTGMEDSQQVSLFVGQGNTVPGEGDCEETLEETGITTQTTDGILNMEKSATMAISPQTQEPEKKKRGGWPKGKRRKKPPDPNTPRAPATGYVLYAIERRQEIKESHPEIPFAEVTKILGQEWSTMPADKKQRYLYEANADKKRYIEELKTFQQSEAYQNVIKKKKLKHGIRGDDRGWTIEENYSDILEDKDTNNLHCRLCDMYFTSLHNKKEHMLGRQHLLNMTEEIQKEVNSQQQAESRLSPPLDSNQLSNHSNGSDTLDTEEKSSDPLDIDGFIHNFLQDNYERELELKQLRDHLKILQEDNLSLYKQLGEYKEYQAKLEQETVNIKSFGASVSSQIDGLKMILTLFGVVNL